MADDDGTGGWLGVEELMQAPQPASRFSQSNHHRASVRSARASAAASPAATTEPAGAAGLTLGSAARPRGGGEGAGLGGDGTAAAAAAVAPRQAKAPVRSRIAGRPAARRAMVSPSLNVVREAESAAQAGGGGNKVEVVIRRRKGPAAVRPEDGVGAASGPRDPRQGPGPRVQVGPFWSMLPVPDKHLQLLRDLQHQYRDEDVLRGLADMLGEEDIPLKYYEWFVSHYARDHRTTCEVVMSDGSTAMLDVHDSYKSSRWAVRKRHWDFFGKRVKVAFDVDGRTHLASVSQLNAYMFARRFGLKELILDAHDQLERHYEQGKVESEAAAIRAAKEAAREAGLPEDAPLKRKRGRRRKPKDAPPPVEPVMLSAGTVTTRLSLQD
jgi:hypothetical protein